eukprot:4702655-Amphidinium_carterae.1
MAPVEECNAEKLHKKLNVWPSMQASNTCYWRTLNRPLATWCVMGSGYLPDPRRCTKARSGSSPVGRRG